MVDFNKHLKRPAAPTSAPAPEPQGEIPNELQAFRDEAKKHFFSCYFTGAYVNRVIAAAESALRAAREERARRYAFEQCPDCDYPRVLIGNGPNEYVCAFCDMLKDNERLELEVRAERKAREQAEELLRTFPEFAKTCTHNEETDYCDSCRFEWEGRLHEWHNLRRAALSKPSGSQPKEQS
jgi:hypothetical protein